MAVTTWECVVENGQVKLPEGVLLADRQTVLLLVSDKPIWPMPRVSGVRLIDPNDAAKFEMKVTWEETP